MRASNLRRAAIATLSAAIVSAGVILPTYADDAPGTGATSPVTAEPSTPGTEPTAEPKKGEWKHDANGWWYQNEDGKTYPKSVVQKIDGTAYRFDENGYMVTGWYDNDGKWEYYQPSGAQGTGWQAVDGKLYFLGEDGTMATGWSKQGDDWYLLNESGAMVTGWAKQGDTWYYLQPSGKMATGSVYINGTWYQFASNGALI